MTLGQIPSLVCSDLSDLEIKRKMMRKDFGYRPDTVAGMLRLYQNPYCGILEPAPLCTNTCARLLISYLLKVARPFRMDAGSGSACHWRQSRLSSPITTAHLVEALTGPLLGRLTTLLVNSAGGIPAPSGAVTSQSFRATVSVMLTQAEVDMIRLKGMSRAQI